MSPIKTSSKGHGFQSSVLEKNTTKTDDNNVYVCARRTKHNGGRKQAPEKSR